MAALGTYSDVGADVGQAGSVHRIKLLPVSADYFDVVRVHPTLRHGFTSEDENGAPAVVLSHKLWLEDMRGDPAVVGKTLDMNGKPYTVTGVMPDGFVDPLLGAVDAWVPLDLTPGKKLSNLSNHYLTVVARLRPTATIGRAESELDALSLRLAARYPDARKVRATLYPLKDDIVGSSSRALELMLGAVGLVLLLVCVNIANLLLVRGSDRAREFAVRSALGAARSRLVRQMLIESITLAVAGDVAGLVIARLAMSAIVALGAGSIPRLASLSLDPALLAFSLVIATMSAVVFGMAPALRASRTQPQDVLREQTRSSTGGAASIRLREWLAVSQVALAFVLLVGAGLLLSSFERIRSVDLGLSPANVLTFELHLPDARYDSTHRALLYDQLPARIEALPGIRAAGATSKLPATGSYNQWGTHPVTGPFANQDLWVNAEQRVIAGDYFRAVGTPLIRGRVFGPQDDASAPKRVVVSQSLADRLFPGMNPIGQRLNTGGFDAEVIGVVGNASLDNEGTPDMCVYHAHRQFAGDRNWSLTQVVSMNGAAQDPREMIRQTIASLDPLLVMYKPAMLENVIGRGEAQRVFTLRILMAFAGVAIALAALRLFGVLAYGVKTRSREFGIRMALGAKQGMIRRMVLGRALLVAGTGVAIGLAASVGVARLMGAMLFHVSPVDPIVLAGAAAFMTVVAGVAAYLPAARATGVSVRSVLQ